MKKILTGLGIVIGLCMGSLWLYAWSLTEPGITFNDSIPLEQDYHSIYYPYRSTRPFYDDLVWITVFFNRNESDRKQYLFDLKEETLLASACAYTNVTTSRKHDITLGSHLIDTRALARITVESWLGVFPSEHGGDTYNLFLQSNTSGEITPLLEACYRIHFDLGAFSPDGGSFYCCSNQGDGYVIDLAEKKLTELPEASVLSTGWWSNHEIIMKNNVDETILYDLRTETFSTLVSPGQIRTFINDQDLVVTDVAEYEIFSVWDGTEYQFLIRSHYDLSNLPPRMIGIAPELGAKEKWLLQINKDTKELEVFDSMVSSFQMQRWNEGLNRQIRVEELDDGKNGLQLYDRISGASRPLLSNREELPEFSAATSWYGGRIVLMSQKALWIMSPDGSGQRQLFPPVE